MGCPTRCPETRRRWMHAGWRTSGASDEYTSLRRLHRSAVDGKPALCTTEGSRADTVREAASVLFIEQ